MHFIKKILFLLAAGTSAFGWIYEPTGGKFSPDGSTIVYLSNEEDYSYNLYVVAADGSERVKFDLRGRLYGEPYFSPGGGTIAFINTDWLFLNGNIFLVDKDGTNLRQVTAYGDDATEITNEPRRLGVLDRGLAFSPDGGRILYSSAEFGTADIFAINADGTEKTRLTEFADYDETAPVFLPGGDTVLFSAKDKGGGGGVWVMNADGSGVKRLSEEDAELVAFSGAGATVAYSECRRDDRGVPDYSTYVAAIDGSTRVKVADEAVGLAFSPDGKRYVYELGGVLYVGGVESEPTVLTANWDYILSPRFFPDGNRIAFLGRREGAPVNIWAVEADGTGLTNVTRRPDVGVGDFLVSPRGDVILYHGGDEEVDYFVVDVESSGCTQLTHGPW
jgi:Tol biopolymer transport system component